MLYCDMVNCFVVGYVSKQSYWMIWFVLEAAMFLTNLYLMADIAQVCVSKRRQDHSLLALTLSLAGSLPREQHMPYQSFVQSVVFRPIKLEIYPFGRVSKRHF